MLPSVCLWRLLRDAALLPWMDTVGFSLGLFFPHCPSSSRRASLSVPAYPSSRSGSRRCPHPYSVPIDMQHLHACMTRFVCKRRDSAGGPLSGCGVLMRPVCRPGWRCLGLSSFRSQLQLVSSFFAPEGCSAQSPGGPPGHCPQQPPAHPCTLP